MKTLREYITGAEKNSRAIGHFNIATLDMFWAVVDALKAERSTTGEDIPVLVGVSEGERDFVGAHEMDVLVNGVRSEGVPVFLNADHLKVFTNTKTLICTNFMMS